LRKQAKKLARDIAVGDESAIARARLQLPHVGLPLTQRQAQLVIAREYGYAGWQDLTAEASKRLGGGLEWAASRARHAIHDNDVVRLKQLLGEYPALLSWRNDRDGQGGLLGFATGSYADAGDPERERWFTRAQPAELLIDSGAVVMPSVCDGLLESRARGLLQLFNRKGLLPRTLKFVAALGDLDAVRTALEEGGNDLAAITEAFVCACGFAHEAVASFLLERSIALDLELGTQVDERVGRPAFVKYFIENRPGHAAAVGPWKAFVMEQISRAVQERDLARFVHAFEHESWLLGEAFVWFQVGLIGNATLNDCGEFIAALLDLDPALLRRQPPPPSQAIEFAFTYAHTHLIPLLTRVWPLPDDLPHAAGMGSLSRVKQWFDESGAARLGDLDLHYPYNDPRARGHLHWSVPTEQQVLDVALAFSVVNRHFDVADFLLDHGADINTNWNSHEPASILHHLVFEDNYDSMQFLIDRGIDMTIKDYRWNSTAQGWALHAKKDERMAQWLEDAERRQAATGRVSKGQPLIRTD
jgi:hypothetical protein